MDFWTAFLLCGAMASVVARAVALLAYGSVKQSSAGVNHGIRGIHGMGTNRIFNAEARRNAE